MKNKAFVWKQNNAIYRKISFIGITLSSILLFELEYNVSFLFE